jgi:lipopolysaccharide/colanic/teichoic acid biosynthesis glycosyltransferase
VPHDREPTRATPTPLRRALTWLAVTVHVPLLVELSVLGLLAALFDFEARLVPLLAAAIRCVRAEPRRLAPSTLHGVRGLVRDLSVALVAAAPFITPARVAGVAVSWGCVVLVLAAGRAMTNIVVRALRRHGLVRERVLVAGMPDEAGWFAAMLTVHPEYGLTPVIATAPLDGSLLADEVRSTGATRLLVVSPGLAPDRVRDLLLTWDERAALHVLIDDPLGLAYDSSRTDDLWGNAVVAAPLRHDRRPTWVLTRAVERVLAAVAIVLLSPALAAIAVAVRRSSPGPILFRQERIGRDGRPFTILKFRSMPVEHRDTSWNAASVAVATPLGRVLRATSLDELPQLFNVVRGEMSLVGPRPEMPHYVDEFSETVPGYRYRHRVPVGLTGWAQAHGLRGDTSLVERVRFDNAYIDRWTLGLELTALAKTARTLLRAPAQPTLPLEEVVIDLRDSALVADDAREHA